MESEKMRKKQKYVPRSHRRIKPRHQQIAQRSLRYAVKMGRVAKPDRCDDCNELTEPSKLAGHHASGYDEPFDVEWLCHSCHAAAHVEEKAIYGLPMIGPAEQLSMC